MPLWAPFWRCMDVTLTAVLPPHMVAGLLLSFACSSVCMWVLVTCEPGTKTCVLLPQMQEFDFACGPQLPLSLGYACAPRLARLYLRTDYNALLYFPSALRPASLELYAVTLGLLFEDADAFCERLEDLCVVYEMLTEAGPSQLARPLAVRGLALASAQLRSREQTVAVVIRGCAFDDGSHFNVYRGMERACCCGQCWACAGLGRASSLYT